MAEDRKDSVEERINTTVRESEDKRSRLERELAHFDQRVRGQVRSPTNPPPPGDDRDRGWRLPWSM